MQLHKVEQNSPEWMKLRNQYRTASEAAIVLGISPFKTPEKFKKEKAGLAKAYYSKAMRLGHELEDQVREHANRVMSRNFQPEVWSNGDYLGSLDGRDDDLVLEVKVSHKTYSDLKAGKIPEYYRAQVVQQIYCSPATAGYIVAYSPDKCDYAFSELITFDADLMDRIKESWEVFDAMPLPDDTPVDRDQDGTIIELFSEYAELDRQVKQMQARMSDIKDRLISETGDQKRGLVAAGYELRYQKPRTTINYKKAAEDAGVDLSKYEKTAPNPTFQIKAPANPFEVEE